MSCGMPRRILCNCVCCARATKHCLSVSDDGRRFDVATVGRGSSFGLVGMRERVLMMGGTLDIDSAPGEGTTLSVRIPLGVAGP